MRAAYANGVLAAFEDAGFRAFDAVYGTSAGGALAAWWSAGQARYALDTWRYAEDPRILSYRRYLLGRGPLLDHDTLFSVVYEDEHPLDVEAVRSAPHPVVVTVTDADTGEVAYKDVRHGPVLDWLRATGRLPLATGPAVEIEGRRWLDGGLAVPIPIERAYADGAHDVVCVLNNPPAERDPEPWYVGALVGLRYPAVRALAAEHHRIHNENAAALATPPEGVTVHVVRPSGPLPTGRLTRDPGRIETSIELGLADGARFLEEQTSLSVP